MRASGNYRSALARHARVDVLVLDDVAVAPMNDQERSDLLEVMADRYGLRSTIVTSPLAPAPGTTNSATRPTPTPSATAS